MDVEPGDRASACRGIMQPLRVEQRRGKGLVLVHRCVSCGFVRANRIADDAEQPDDIDAIIVLMSAPR